MSEQALVCFCDQACRCPDKAEEGGTPGASASEVQSNVAREQNSFCFEQGRIATPRKELRNVQD